MDVVNRLPPEIWALILDCALPSYAALRMFTAFSPQVITYMTVVPVDHILRAVHQRHLHMFWLLLEKVGVASHPEVVRAVSRTGSPRMMRPMLKSFGPSVFGLACDEVLDNGRLHMMHVPELQPCWKEAHLYKAARMKPRGILHVVLASGVGWSKQDKIKAFQEAAHRGMYENCRMLKGHGARPRPQDLEWENRPELFKILLSVGGDTSWAAEFRPSRTCRPVLEEMLRQGVMPDPGRFRELCRTSRENCAVLAANGTLAGEILEALRDAELPYNWTGRVISTF